jgi:hypothetical protein
MVARGWADSLLLAVGSAPGPTITRLGEPSGNIEYTAMVAEWLMSQARRAAQRGERVDTAESFAQSAGTTRCRLLAFPLTGPSGAVEQVLCHVCLAEDGARPERRGWFSA